MMVWGVGRGEYDIFSDDTGKEWLWARCEVRSCSCYVCTRISERFCWVHSMTGGATDIEKEEHHELQSAGIG